MKISNQFLILLAISLPILLQGNAARQKLVQIIDVVDAIGRMPQKPASRVRQVPVSRLEQVIDLVDHLKAGAAKDQEILKECNLCGYEGAPDDFTTLQCGDEFCTDCLQHQLDTGLTDKSSAGLTCSTCNQPFTEQDIKNISQRQADFEAWAEIKTRELLASDSDLRKCPTPNCKALFITDPEHPREITCNSCQQQYCSNCLVKHDPRITCEQAQELRSENEVMAKYIQEHHLKPCPNCKSMIEKDAGCSHVLCENCMRHGSFTDFCHNCYGDHPHAFPCTYLERELDEHGIPQLTPQAKELAAQWPQAHINTWTPLELPLNSNLRDLFARLRIYFYHQPNRVLLSIRFQGNPPQDLIRTYFANLYNDMRSYAFYNPIPNENAAVNTSVYDASTNEHLMIINSNFFSRARMEEFIRNVNNNRPR